MKKHEKLCIGLGIAAIILIVISCCPGGLEQATGVLQGVATGLISGLVLFLVTGTKNREINEIDQRLEYLNTLVNYFEDINQIITTFSDYRYSLFEPAKQINVEELTTEFLALFQKLQAQYSNFPSVEIMMVLPNSISVINDLSIWLDTTRTLLFSEAQKFNQTVRKFETKEQLSIIQNHMDSQSYANILINAFYKVAPIRPKATDYHFQASHLLLPFQEERERIDNSFV